MGQAVDDGFVLARHRAHLLVDEGLGGAALDELAAGLPALRSEADALVGVLALAELAEDGVAHGVGDAVVEVLL